MKAPDKIYIHEASAPFLDVKILPPYGIEYIRKEALLEWKEELEEHVRKCAGGIVGRYEHGYWKALDDLIDKLNDT